MTVTVADGRYELGALLGTGGMSQVRRATDTLLGRDVAVKVFRDDLDDDSAARARQEMQTLAQLSHPRLVAVHDAGTGPDGRPYLVMELVEGPTLADRCRDGSLTSEGLRGIGADLAEALAYVHALGIVHRDVKPANVLLAPSGAKLADFGVARIIDGARHTGTGLTIGTAPYLSPEQVTGGDVDPPADVYSLGLVLLEGLTGRREYDGNPVEAALARLHREPTIPEHLPTPWPALLRAMTARAASDRPTAGVVASVLRGEREWPGVDGAQSPQTTVLATESAAAMTTVLRSAGGATAAADSSATALTRVEPLRVPLRPATTDAGLRLPKDEEPSRRRTPVIAAVVSAGVLLVVAIIGSLGGGGGTSDPSPVPGTRPTLEQHLTELKDAVTP